MVPNEELKNSLSLLPKSPGVYLFYNNRQVVLYIGKAIDLKKRVFSYFSNKRHDIKTRELVSHIHSLETIQTKDEYQALLLENNLIKEHRPKYNIALKDGKGYPFLVTNPDHPYPRLDYHQGPQAKKGVYYGPYTHKAAVKSMLNEIQRIFQIRQCSDHFFKARSRPCILYQIKRCSAPCVGLITQEAYTKQVEYATLFLTGKNKNLLEKWQTQMNQASQCLDYELAAKYRDLIRQYHQFSGKTTTKQTHCNIDIITGTPFGEQIHLLLLWVREGQLLGKKHFIFDNQIESQLSTVITKFLCQYYITMAQAYGLPDYILSQTTQKQFADFRELIKNQYNHNVKKLSPNANAAKRWLPIASKNLKQHLQKDKLHQSTILLSEPLLKRHLEMTTPPCLIECFDISHTSGSQTIASCVVFNETGPYKSKYRSYRIPMDGKPDDYHALAYVFKKRYLKIKESNCTLPDLIIVDGGKGQLNTLVRVLTDLNLEYLRVLAIAKGKSRKPGQETIHTIKQADIKLSPHSQALHWLQHIRDEAHRFALKQHRRARNKESLNFIIETIPGIGKEKRIALYNHFGGIAGIKKASVNDLLAVKGINQALAERIIQFIQDNKNRL